MDNDTSEEVTVQLQETGNKYLEILEIDKEMEKEITAQTATDPQAKIKRIYDRSYHHLRWFPP